MTCKFCGSPLPDGAMICDLCGNNQKASKPVGAFSFEGSRPATEKKGKPADRWNTGPSASMEGAGTDDIVPVKVKRKKVRGSFPIKKILVVLLVLAVLGGGAFGAWWYITNHSVDENEEIVESFKKIARAKNAEFSVIISSSSMGQMQAAQTMDGGFVFEKSDKRFVSWVTAQNETSVNCLTETAGYTVTPTTERYYNLYLSNPSDFPNEKIVMVGTECYDIVTMPAESNNYKEMEDLFTEKMFDSMEKEQDDAELLASMSEEERKLYDAAKKFQAELTDPDFIKDVLNAKRTKTSDAIIYEFDVDLAAFLQKLYSSMEGVLPAGQSVDLSSLKNISKDDMDKMGFKCTGRLTIKDGYASMLTGKLSIGVYGSVDLDMRVKNPGRTEIPDDVKKMLDAITAK